MTTSDQVLNVARSQLGYREGPNNATKYGAWYRLDHSPWCDMFVSWVASTAGAGAIIGKFAYTPWHAKWFKDQGRWGGKPKVGAIVFFQFPGYSRISHVGIVEAMRADGSIVTIEGNTNNTGSRNGNGVYRMVRRANIAGYGYPAYVNPPKPVASPSKPRVSLAAVVAAAGKDGARPQGGTTPGAKDDVLLVEKALAAEGLLQKWAIDGSFGTLTVSGYSKWQEKLGFTGKDANGIPGPSSLAALGKRHGFVVVS